MKKVLVLLAVICFAASAFAAYKNLQVFPKNISQGDLGAKMKAISAALGVQCSHCHDMSAFDKDTDKKKVARYMLKMTGEINAKYSGDFPSKKKIGCITCHNGQKTPQMI